MSNKIVYGIYNQRSEIRNFDMYLRFKGMTLFYLKRINRDVSIICEDTIEEVLLKSFSAGFDYCVVQSAGCTLKSFEYDREIAEFISQNNFGVAGHPLWWPNRWLELHPQFFIINLRAWDQVGRPDFGTWEYAPQMLPVIERSVENFHDDYTPLWVKPTGEKSLQGKAGQGWKLLSAMFENEWPVITLSERIRFNKFYHYPESDTYKFEESIKTLTPYPGQNWNQSKSINDAKCVKDQIWLFNSEPMRIRNQGKFDLTVNTASGFKIFDLLKHDKVSDNARVIVYDFNPKSLSWYQQFYTWHNENLLECIRAFPDKKYFTWIGQTDPEYNENASFNNLYRTTLEYFGGEEKFQELWRKFKSMPVTFAEVDLYKNPQQFAELFVGSGNKFVNLSNIFSTDATNLIFGHVEIQAAQQRCLGYLYIVDQEIEITLYDFWNRHLEGKIKDIL